MAHSKAIGTPREKAIALAYLASFVEIFEGAEEDQVANVLKANAPEFNNEDFDPNRTETSRLMLVIPPDLEARMRAFARIRFVRARRQGTMLAPTPAEYIRHLLKNDIENGYAAIDRRRSEVD